MPFSDIVRFRILTDLRSHREKQFPIRGSAALLHAAVSRRLLRRQSSSLLLTRRGGGRSRGFLVAGRARAHNHSGNRQSKNEHDLFHRTAVFNVGSELSRSITMRYATPL
jgi:hypothetical protein